jgi:hypothetical protein
MDLDPIAGRTESFQAHLKADSVARRIPLLSKTEVASGPRVSPIGANQGPRAPVLLSHTHLPITGGSLQIIDPPPLIYRYTERDRPLHQNFVQESPSEAEPWLHLRVAHGKVYLGSIARRGRDAKLRDIHMRLREHRFLDTEIAKDRPVDWI